MTTVCEVTVKFNAKDPAKSHTKTFTSWEGEWAIAHEMSNDYARKHFAEGELVSMSHLNHAIYSTHDNDF